MSPGAAAEAIFDTSKVWAIESHLLSGVAANDVARVVIVGSSGRRHPARLSPDQGFFYNCNTYLGCGRKTVALIEAYDHTGKLLSRTRW